MSTYREIQQLYVHVWTVIQNRTAFFCVTTRRVVLFLTDVSGQPIGLILGVKVIIYYRRFGTAYSPILGVQVVISY